MRSCFTRRRRVAQRKSQTKTFVFESLSDLCGSARYKRFIERRSHAEARSSAEEVTLRDKGLNLWISIV